MLNANGTSRLKSFTRKRREKSVVKSNKPLINLLSIFRSPSTCLHYYPYSMDRPTPVHVCMMIETSRKNFVCWAFAAKQLFIINFFSIIFSPLFPHFSISLVLLFRIYIKMTQENVIVWENNKKNDKDNILSKRSRGRNEQRQRHELFIIMQKREEYATSFSRLQPLLSPTALQPLVTRLESKKYVVIAKENVPLWRATWKRRGEWEIKMYN